MHCCTVEKQFTFQLIGRERGTAAALIFQLFSVHGHDKTERIFSNIYALDKRKPKKTETQETEEKSVAGMSNNS